MSVCNNAPGVASKSRDRKYKLSLPEYKAVSIRNVTEIWEELSATVFRVKLVQEECFRGHKETIR
jgi:hypothetical protein